MKKIECIKIKYRAEASNLLLDLTSSVGVFVRIFCCSSLNKITNWIFWGFQMSVRRCPKMSSGIFWDILWINSRLIEKIIQSQFRSITLTHSMKNTHSFKKCSQARSGSRPYALCWNAGKFETGSAKQEQEEEVGSLSRFSSQKS